MSDTDSDLTDNVGNDADHGADGYPTWMAQLPEEYKKDEYGKNYKTMGEFYKTHKGLRAKLDKMLEDHPPLIEAIKERGWSTRYQDAELPF